MEKRNCFKNVNLMQDGRILQSDLDPSLITRYDPTTSRHASHLEVVSRASGESCLSYEICNRVGAGFNEEPWHNGVNASEEASVYHGERKSTLSRRLINFCKNNPWMDRKVSPKRVSLPNFHVLKNYSLWKTCIQSFFLGFRSFYTRCRF